MSIILRTPTTLITGFLGSGKTTLINRLLGQMPPEKWAILVNEFGKIGIDGKLFDSPDIAIKEVSGGCICCTSQLPLQIAIARLLADHRPDRLIIEPTGLAHADELAYQLTQSHWQTSLALSAIICVVNAAQWTQEKYRLHDGYQSHIRHADIVMINRTEVLGDDGMDDLSTWIHTINPNATIINLDTTDDTALKNCLHQTHAKPKISKTALSLSPQRTASDDTTADIAPPFRYHETALGFEVGGWQLPTSWVFDSAKLQLWLLNLPNYARIKGVIATDEGWLRFNITPDAMSVSDTDHQNDSRLELIFDKPTNWQQLDDELMALLIDKAPTN